MSSNFLIAAALDILLLTKMNEKANISRISIWKERKTQNDSSRKKNPVL
jgi:hypothetical protein